jgi:hypothetical protein
MVGGRCVVGGVGAKERADGRVTWNDYVLRHHGIPLAREIGEGYGPKCFLGIGRPFKCENEAPLECMIQIAFVEGTVMIDGDFGVALENIRKGVEWIR